jgi:membrane protein
MNAVPPLHARIEVSSQMSSLRSPKHFLALLGEAATAWVDDECYRRGASLSYYAVFSLFPLLLLCVAAIGFVMGHDDSLRGRLLDYVARSGAPEVRPLLDETLASMQKHETARGIGAIVGLVTIFLGASGVFSELEAALNVIWRVKAQAGLSIWGTVLRALEDKGLSFLVVMGASMAILLSVLLSTGLSSLGATTEQLGLSPLAWIGVEALGSVGLLTLLFAMMFRMIPHTDVAWRDVWRGALLTAILFAGLKRLLAWYFGHLGSYAAYGAVGGFLGLLAWIYFASLILLFGAEFSHASGERYGSRNRNSEASGNLHEKARDVEDRTAHPDGSPKPHSFTQRPVRREREHREGCQRAQSRNPSTKTDDDGDV